MTARATKAEKVRFTRLVAYVEPDLLIKAKTAAAQDGETISTWLRGVIVKQMLANGTLTKDELLGIST